jgi:prevent-host-death family protein
MLDYVTISGQDKVMKRAKVSELKSRLSSYLAEVRSGETVIVCDRATPIARLVPFEQEMEAVKIRESGRPMSELSRIRSVRLRKRINADEILRQVRGDR